MDMMFLKFSYLFIERELGSERYIWIFVHVSQIRPYKDVIKQNVFFVLIYLN